MKKLKLVVFVFIVFNLLVSFPSIVFSAEYDKQIFKDIEVVYAAKLSVKDSSGSQREAIFGVVGLWLPSEIKTPDYFDSYESWRDTLLGSSDIIQKEIESFEQVYTEDIIKHKYEFTVTECQKDPSRFGEPCNYLGTIKDFTDYLRNSYESTMINPEVIERRRNKIFSEYTEEEIQEIYKQQKSLLDRSLWTRDVKLYFEIDKKRMLNDFVAFDFYGNGKIKAIYAKFLELDDWKEELKKDLIPDAEVLFAFDENGNIDNRKSRIVIPPTDIDSTALACIDQSNVIPPPGGTVERNKPKFTACNSHNQPLLLEGQDEEYDFFRILQQEQTANELGGLMPSEVTDLCASDNLETFQELSSHRECSPNEVLSVIDATGLFTVALLETNDIIKFGWNWGEDDTFLWGEWNLANLYGISYSGCKFDEVKTVYKIVGKVAEIIYDPSLYPQPPNVYNETLTLGTSLKDFNIELAVLHKREKVDNGWTSAIAFIDFDGKKGRLLNRAGAFHFIDKEIDKIKNYYGLLFDFNSKSNILELELHFNSLGQLDLEKSRIYIVPLEKQKSLEVCFGDICQSYKIVSTSSSSDLLSGVFPSIDVFEATKTLAPDYCGEQYNNEPGIIDGVYICASNIRLKRSGYSDILLGYTGRFQTYCTGIEAFPSQCQVLTTCSIKDLCEGVK